jgi:predicted RNase H-like HicB family nuclease
MTTIMASSTRNSDVHDGEIRLWHEDDWWIAKDVDTGVTTQGRSREAALDNLDEAVALHEDERGREPTDEELRELGIDPAANATGDDEPPDVLQ